MADTPNIILDQAYVVDPLLGTCEKLSVAVGGGQILAVGTSAEILSLRDRATEVIDLKGAYISPGFVDGHIHALSGVDTMNGADLYAVDEIKDIAARLKLEADKLPADGWVRGHSLNPSIVPTLSQGQKIFEEVLGGRPAYLVAGDHHSAYASQAALALAGVTGSQKFSSGSEILCDADGKPNGVLIESDAMKLVSQVMPKASHQARCQAVLDTFKSMAATGLTGCHVMDANGDCFDLLCGIEEQQTLPLRLSMAPWINPGASQQELDHVLAQQAWHGRHWKVGSAKFFIDGTIDAGTAWLLEPDTQGEGLHAFWPEPLAYRDAVHFFAKQGVQTITHAIGDKAVRFVLDVLEAVPEAKRRAGRHRVEHLEALPDSEISRFASLGVIPSMQPTHATRYLAADMSDGWSQKLGPTRARRAFRCQDIARTGAPLVLGTDWPVAPYDPRSVLAAARSRREPNTPDSSAITPNQALTAQEALAGITVHAATALGEGGVSGRILPGMRADITVMTVNPFTAPTDDLVQAPIRMTMMDGGITHSLA